MVSVSLCVAAFFLAYLAGRRSLVAGIIVVLSLGYFYGLLRANLPETGSHFIFDASVLGLYLTQLPAAFKNRTQSHLKSMREWVVVLIAWPLMLFVLPIQDYSVQLVGLRGNIFMLPFLLLGARLKGDDIRKLALAFAVLNVVAFSFATAEYYLGLERFYPQNEVTELIYRSVVDEDYANPDRSTALRIPATFTSAHAFGGTMVLSFAFLFGAWVHKAAGRYEKRLLLLAMVFSITAIFMAAARSPVIILGLLLATTLFPGRLRLQSFALWLIMLCGVGWIVSSEDRLQRFLTLKDVDIVSDRISISVNANFFEVLTEYPMGNGLGGGGTSIPYFLQDRVIPPTVFMENEYARIVLEQGIFGLLLWIAFIAWLFLRRPPGGANEWLIGRRLVWVVSAAFFVTGMIGVGLFTSIPGTVMMFLGVGWIAARQSQPSGNWQTTDTRFLSNRFAPRTSPGYQQRIDGATGKLSLTC
jgi:hypothetical protein